MMFCAFRVQQFGEKRTAAGMHRQGVKPGLSDPPCSATAFPFQLFQLTDKALPLGVGQVCAGKALPLIGDLGLDVVERRGIAWRVLTLDEARYGGADDLDFVLAGEAWTEPSRLLPAVAECEQATPASRPPRGALCRIIREVRQDSLGQD